MEEYIEGGHKDHYKDIKMEKPPPLTSPGDSGNGNQPERCPHFLYSRDSTQEGHSIPHNDQDDKLKDMKAEMKEVEETVVSGAPQCMEESEMIIKSKQEESSLYIGPNGSTSRNQPKRCPHRLYYWDSTQKGHSLPHNNQDEGQKDMKAKIKEEEEEMVVSGAQQSMEESEMNMKSKQVESSLYIDTNGQNRNYNIVVISTFGKTKDEDITTNSSEENPSSQNVHPTPQGADLSPGSFTHGERFPDLCDPVTYHTKGEIFSSSESGKCFNEKAHLPSNEGSDTVEEPYSCSECGKCFSRLSILKKHERTHTGEKPYSCTECGKCFTTMSGLKTHKMCSSPDIGQCVPNQDGLTKHHTGERPFSCRECGKCFSQKSNLIIHERSHTGERPHFCTHCGKCFSTTTNLASHRKTHTGEKPYWCSECGKCFSQKSNLITHERSHTGEKPYSCTDCGKSFSTTANLTSHRKTHTGEKPYSCSECGKCFSWKACLIRHQRVHTG